jgi:hypothetical protein
MIHDRRPLLPILCDKEAAKGFVTERLGRGWVAQTLAVSTDPTAIDWRALPPAYAAKVTHASGGVILVTPSAQRQPIPTPAAGRFERFLVHPNDADCGWIRDVLTSWLHQRYGVDKGEWAYGQVAPRVLVEEYLSGADGLPPADVKFFIAHGRCVAYRVDSPGDRRKRLDHFLPDGTPLPVRFGEYHGPFFERSTPTPVVPSKLNDMRTAAEVLAGDLDFLRVDMFQIGERIVVGELTLYPTSGTGRFSPVSFDRWLGSFWNVSVSEGADTSQAAATHT